MQNKFHTTKGNFIVTYKENDIMYVIEEHTVDKQLNHTTHYSS